MVFRINRKQQQAIQIKLKEKNALSSKELAWDALSVKDRIEITTLGSESGREAQNLTIINSEFFREPDIPKNKIGTRFTTGLTKIQKVPTTEQIKTEKEALIAENEFLRKEDEKFLKNSSNKKLKGFLDRGLGSRFQREMIKEEIVRRS